MIINSAPQDQAVLSNVGQIGEFRIRNSAKAFSILSSGLYANKVKAIIRELSCNAVDSHVAAGKVNTPFDVHLPNALEPHFSIRDYGTGLSHDQVTNIYTTYFESSKTDSNAFIGALGLGSKSPFSYTDNFTVTAIKDGRKGIYTAFINEQGVPSIARMMDEATTDPSGVEVKFSVNDRYDFDKFRQEARNVYKYFKLQPVVSGVSDFVVPEIVYADKDIIAGVHSVSGSTVSMAIMGNIAYPIDVPASDLSIDADIRRVLKYGLIMEFNIGELDFQASREGLSYIPSTIAAIKTKLDATVAELSTRLATEADQIENAWERSYFLIKKYNQSLWGSAVLKYVSNTGFELFDSVSYDKQKKMELNVSELSDKFNISIKGFVKSRSYAAVSDMKVRAKSRNTAADGTIIVENVIDMKIHEDAIFVVNDLKTGALTRAKFHFRTSQQAASVFVIEAVNKKKSVNTTEFFKYLSNPPGKQIINASALNKKESTRTIGKNVTILRLAERKRHYGYRESSTFVWEDAGKADTYDSATTFYYVPLSGYTSVGVFHDAKVLHQHLISTGIHNGALYGVRKSDIAFIKTQKNWVNIDEHVKTKLSNYGPDSVMGVVKKDIKFDDFYLVDATKLVNANSPYAVFHQLFKDVKNSGSKEMDNAMKSLCQAYKVNVNFDLAALIIKYKSKMNQLHTRYPLLGSLHHSVTRDAVAEYVNLIDQSKATIQI